MLIGMRNAMLSGGKFSAKSYVQDGLVAMWDGIENAGWGVHDPNATVWKDLVGDCDMALSNAQILSDHVYFSKSAGYGTAGFPQSYGAIEIVLAKNSSQANGSDCTILNIGRGYTGWGICAPTNRLMDTNDSAAGPYVRITGDIVFSATLNKQGAITTSIAKNGIIKSDGTVYAGGRYTDPYSNNSLNQSIGTNRGRASDLWVRALRIYANNLTAAEIAANYAVDKARFNLPDAT